MDPVGHLKEGITIYGSFIVQNYDWRINRRDRVTIWAVGVTWGFTLLSAWGVVGSRGKRDRSQMQSKRLNQDTMWWPKIQSPDDQAAAKTPSAALKHAFRCHLSVHL